MLYTCNLFLQGLTLLALEQPGRLGKLFFQLTLKQRVSQKKTESKMTGAMKARLEEAADAIAELRPETISYSDDIVRQEIDCVRVLSAIEIEITFKGGAKRKIPLTRQ